MVFIRRYNKNEFIDKLIDAKSALEDLNNINIGGKFPKGGSSGGGSVSQSEIERIAREHNVDMVLLKIWLKLMRDWVIKNIMKVDL